MSPNPLRCARTLAALLSLLLAGAAQATGYAVSTIDLPGGSFWQGFDVNNHGVAVATSSGAVDTVGYLVNGSVFTPLSGPAGALGTSALGISDGGVVVGSYYTEHVTDENGNLVAGPQTAFVLAGGVYTPFAAPGFVSTTLRGISSDGRYITGYAVDASDITTAFVYDRTLAVFTPIVSSPLLTIAHGVNNAGTVVGSEIIPGPSATVREAFTYDVASGTLSTFQIAGALDTRYRAIDETGLVAGWYQDGTGIHGFIGPTTSFTTFDVAGAANTYVEGINDAGWLAGIYDDGSDNSHAFLATPVPEPAAAVLMLLGLAALPLYRRRR